jgi:hypothetical protein
MNAYKILFPLILIEVYYINHFVVYQIFNKYSFKS